jgi:hypothetical protein
VKRGVALAVGLVGLAAVATLARGYWHAASHGSLYVSVRDESDRDRQRSLRGTELWLLDSTGTVRARASAALPSGAFYISDPPLYACRDVEERAPFSVEAREEWDRCFERQSRWLVTWIRDTRFVDLRTGECWIRKMPVSVSEHADDWWLWWVPLRHIGGAPYTSFSIDVVFDGQRCAYASAR